MLRARQIIMALTAAALLTACSDEAPLAPVEEGSSPISFGNVSVASVNDADTRGRMIEDNRHMHDNMNVYAYTWQYTGSFDPAKVNTNEATLNETTDVAVLMNRETVRLVMPVPGDEHWYYNPIKRWPDKGKVRFYAYTPDEENTSILQVSSGHLPTLTYIMPSELNKQKELMIATPIERDMSTQGTGEVDFNFNHVMSAVRFKIDQSVTSDLLIKSIKLVGLKNKATFSLENAQMIGSPSVEGGATGADFLLDFTTVYPVDGGYQFNAATPDYSKVINPLDDTFLVIPQTCGSGSKVELVLDEGGSDQKMSVTLENTTWQAGYVYTYKIAFKNRRLVLIPSVQAWSNAPEYTGFTAAESVVSSYTSFKLYNTAQDYTPANMWNDAYVAVAAGELTYQDEFGLTVNTHVPLYSPRISLRSSSSDALVLESDNPQVRFVTINTSTGDYNTTQQTTVNIPAGDDVQTIFHVVPVDGALSSPRTANVRLRRTGSSPAYLPWAHKDLPRTQDYVSMRVYLMTEAEYNGGLTTVDR